MSVFQPVILERNLTQCRIYFPEAKTCSFFTKLFHNEVLFKRNFKAFRVSPSSPGWVTPKYPQLLIASFFYRHMPKSFFFFFLTMWLSRWGSYYIKNRYYTTQKHSNLSFVIVYNSFIYTVLH